MSADTDQNKIAAYPADASDGRGFYWAAIREHLVKVAPKQMHLVSCQMSFNRRTTFPSRKDLHAGCAAPDIVHGTEDRPTIGSTTRRGDGASSGVRIMSLLRSTREYLRRPCVKAQTGRFARRVCQDGACDVRPSLAALRTAELRACVRSRGFGKELQGVSRQRASPRISTHN